MIPVTTTMLTFCPGHVATNINSFIGGGRDVNLTDETFTHATSHQYENPGGCPIYYSQKVKDPQVNP